MLQGMVFNIQKFCVHDGPGIRSIVFFKGCPLECKWCSNPEGMASCSEITYKKSKCISTLKCGYCITNCPSKAISTLEGLAHIDRAVCQHCYQCTAVCPAKAMEKMGRLMTVQEVMSKIEEDGIFYSRSGGGLTLSGGEPLIQADFAVALLMEARKSGLTTAIETTGCVPWEKAEKVFTELDFIHYDLKSLDSEKHRAFTGQGNELILANFKKLCQQFPNKPIIVRTPVIPGFNDTMADIQIIADFINEVGQGVANIQYELLTFHNFGSSKYEFQGKAYELMDLPNMDKQVVADLKAQVQSAIAMI